MAYTILRVKLSMWRDPFKNTEDDSDFQVDTYPELDEYLSLMEQRGWRVVNATPMTTNLMFILVTLHRPDS